MARPGGYCRRDPSRLAVQPRPAGCIGGDTYPKPAFPGAPRIAQAEQAANLAGYLNTLGPDLGGDGDFNSAPWSRVQTAFRAATGLDNEGRPALTWPAWGWAAIRLPIDQIFTRGALHATGFKSGPVLGSDHLPVEAMILIAQ